MKKAIIVEILCFWVVPIYLSGCGMRYVGPKEPARFNSLRLTDPNNSPFKIINRDPNTKETKIQGRTAIITLDKPCRVNYRREDFKSGKQVMVTGVLPNGKECPVWIDSGCTGTEILVNDIVVKENKLETLYNDRKHNGPNDTSISKRECGGLCYLPLLKIDELTIQNPLCAYVPWHPEYWKFGIPVWRPKSIFFGISIMSRFRYIRFDNTQLQLEFSYNQSFQPENSSQWANYPFILRTEDDIIVADIPIEGQTYKIFFDTGGAATILTSQIWEDVRKKIVASEPKKGSYLHYQYGSLTCHRTIVETITIGNIELKNAEIVIIPDDDKYSLKNMPALLSIWTFKDTSVVLDFEHKLMWVKNQQSEIK